MSNTSNFLTLGGQCEFTIQGNIIPQAINRGAQNRQTGLYSNSADVPNYGFTP